MEEKQFYSNTINGLDYKYLIDDSIYWQFVKYLGKALDIFYKAHTYAGKDYSDKLEI